MNDTSDGLTGDLTPMSGNSEMKLNISDMERKLSGYDVITFDVFDTLITRCVCRPADVFSLVEAAARDRGLIQNGFARDRIRAEAEAYTVYGDTAGLAQIYELLGSRFNYTQDQCAALMALELDMERKTVIPRRDMLDLVLALREAGRRIVLCSDMYLNSAQIRELLSLCGYPDDLEIWVSCEKGGTKHSGKLWKQFFAGIPAGQRVIHVGDNEDGDYRALKRLGREALLIPSGLARFETSDLYGYLSKFMDGGIGCSLVLGYLINRACFNSPFADSGAAGDITAVWAGAAFVCFMDFLVQSRDDSQLLFVTREGYLLQPMYQRYCRSLGQQPQSNALCYASRAAAVAAAVASEQDVRNAMQRPEFTGTLGQFARNRLNYDLSADTALCGVEIRLPEQAGKAFQLLKPHLGRILEKGVPQNRAYRQYLSGIRQEGKPLTVVDVGYNGTIQYALARILNEKVSGRYLFLNDGALPRALGCACTAVAGTRDGSHPIYENLLFLEAIMQVPYGQLQRMTLENGRVTPIFNRDANFSPEIPAAQEQFCGFVEWFGDWQKTVGGALQPDFELAEAIWACLLKFNCLPDNLLDALWLADDFCGTPMWRYDRGSQQWQGKAKVTPLAFSLVRSGETIGWKQRLKAVIKRNIPMFAYDWASKIWVKYIK